MHHCTFSCYSVRDVWMVCAVPFHVQTHATAEDATTGRTRQTDNGYRLCSRLYPIQSNISHKSLFTSWWSGQQSCIKHMVMCKVILLLFSPLVILFLVWLAGAGNIHSEWWRKDFFFGRMCCLSGRRLFKMCPLFTLLKAIKDSVGSTARNISIYMWQSHSYHSDWGWTKHHYPCQEYSVASGWSGTKLFDSLPL